MKKFVKISLISIAGLAFNVIIIGQLIGVPGMIIGSIIISKFIINTWTN